MRPDLQNIDTNGIRLRVALAGQGPLVILIHGFPESWYRGATKSRRSQTPAIGLLRPTCAVMRPATKPLAIEAYSLKNLCADISGLIAALGEERASSSATTGARRLPTARLRCIRSACVPWRA